MDRYCNPHRSTTAQDCNRKSINLHRSPDDLLMAVMIIAIKDDRRRQLVVKSLCLAGLPVAPIGSIVRS